MAQQVKFYAVTASEHESKKTAGTINAGGIYFITDTKQIYKGSELYGAAQVFTATSASGASTAADFTSKAVKGDILTGVGAAKVFDGTSFIDIGGSDYSDVISGESGNRTITASTITASTITVSDTATVSTVNASALAVDDEDDATFGGSTISQIADRQISAIASATASATSNGITVSVTTSGGKVTAVSIDATSLGNAMDFKGVVTSSIDENPSNGDLVVVGEGTTLYITSAGVITTESKTTTGEGDDAVTTDNTALTAGQEYIYVETTTGEGDDAVTTGKWELIGDQSTVNGIAASVTTIDANVSSLTSAINTLNAGSTSEGSIDYKIAAAISNISTEMAWFDADGNELDDGTSTSSSDE